MFGPYIFFISHRQSKVMCNLFAGKHTLGVQPSIETSTQNQFINFHLMRHYLEKNIKIINLHK